MKKLTEKLMKNILMHNFPCKSFSMACYVAGVNHRLFAIDNFFLLSGLI